MHQKRYMIFKKDENLSEKEKLHLKKPSGQQYLQRFYLTLPPTYQARIRCGEDLFTNIYIKEEILWNI
jgi:hypothetical protein